MVFHYYDYGVGAYGVAVVAMTLSLGYVKWEVIVAKYYIER